jgi:hypothetical protein
MESKCVEKRKAYGVLFHAFPLVQGVVNRANVISAPDERQFLFLYGDANKTQSNQNRIFL